MHRRVMTALGMAAIGGLLAMALTGCAQAATEATPPMEDESIFDDSVTISDPVEPEPEPEPEPETEPAVEVTRESGKSPCFIVDVFESGGADYVVLDFVQRKSVQDDFEIVNDNPKLRTFEVPDDGWLGAFWLLETLHGEGTVRDWGADESSYDPADWRGTAISLSDIKTALDRGIANEFEPGHDRWWNVSVEDGRVRSLVEEYQD